MAAKQGQALATVLAPAVAIGALGVMAWTARYPGVWADEIWSLWMADPGISFPTVLTERWMRDTHPPLFYLCNWVAARFVGLDLLAHRLLNLAPALYFLLACLFVWRRSAGSRAFILVFATLLLTSRAAVWYFPELRSYFAVVMIVGALCVLLYDTFRAEDLDLRRDRGLAAFLALTIILALNLHYITVVFVGAVLGSAILAHVWRRRRRTPWLIFCAVAVALPLLAATIAGQWSYLASVSGDFWITTLPREAARLLAEEPVRAIGSNRIAALAGVAVVGTALFRRGSASPLVAQPPRGAWEFATAAAAGVTLASLVLLLISLAKPILVPRYLVGVVPVSAAALAAVAAPAIVSKRWIVALFCLNAAVLLGLYAQAPLHNPRWTTTIDHIRRVVAACPATRVYGLDRRFNQRKPTPAGPAILTWGLQREGRLNGFQVTRLDSLQSRPPALSRTCPTLLWAEHVDLKSGPSDLVRAPFAQTPEMKAVIASATVFRGTSGFVVEIPPASGSAGVAARP